METTEPFVSYLLTSTYVKKVRVGNWLHTLDLITGESKWEWIGPERPPEAERFIFSTGRRA